MIVKNTAAWYAMRVTYRRELVVKEYLDKLHVQNFIPMQYRFFIKGKQKKRELVPVVHNLIFVYATLSQIQCIKKELPCFQYMMDSRTGQKIIVPEKQMQLFIAVSGTYNEQLLYFKPEELNLAKGTGVRICGGEFEGQEGIYLKVKGARDRRVVIVVQGVVAVAMVTIHPDLIRVIPDSEKK